jgi:uncharacterized protein GlcG (DUF336 family)
LQIVDRDDRPLIEEFVGGLTVSGIAPRKDEHVKRKVVKAAAADAT